MCVGAYSTFVSTLLSHFPVWGNTLRNKSTVGSEAKIILLSAIIKVKKYPVNFYIYFQVIASR